jgi:hypothetical protein
MGIFPGECDDDDDYYFFFQNIWDVILPIDELIFCKMVKTTKPVSMCGAFLKWGSPKIIRN